MTFRFEIPLGEMGYCPALVERLQARQRIMRAREAELMSCPKPWTGKQQAPASRLSSWWVESVQSANDFLASPEFAAIPSRFVGATRAAAVDPQAFAAVMAHDNEENSGLFLHGPSGTGKTSAGVYRAISRRDDERFVTASDFALAVSSSRSDREGFVNLVRYLAGSHDRDGEESDYPGILILDDLSHPKWTEAFGRYLFQIVSERTSRQLQLIVTSQLSPRALLDKWKREAPRESPESKETAKAVARRLWQECANIEFRHVAAQSETADELTAPAPPPPASEGPARADNPAAPPDASTGILEPNPEPKDNHESDHRPINPEAGRDDCPPEAEIHARGKRTLHEPEGGGIDGLPYF